MTLVQTDELEVEIAVPENHIDDVAVGTPVKVSFWALSQEVDGTVREVAPMADSTSRTYKCASPFRTRRRACSSA